MGVLWLPHGRNFLLRVPLPLIHFRWSHSTGHAVHSSPPHNHAAVPPVHQTPSHPPWSDPQNSSKKGEKGQVTAWRGSQSVAMAFSVTMATFLLSEWLSQVIVTRNPVLVTWIFLTHEKWESFAPSIEYENI